MPTARAFARNGANGSTGTTLALDRPKSRTAFERDRCAQKPPVNRNAFRQQMIREGCHPQKQPWKPYVVEGADLRGSRRLCRSRRGFPISRFRVHDQPKTLREFADAPIDGTFDRNAKRTVCLVPSGLASPELSAGADCISGCWTATLRECALWWTAMLP